MVVGMSVGGVVGLVVGGGGGSMRRSISQRIVVGCAIVRLLRLAACLLAEEGV
jgi:hypothetical protein